MNKIKQHWKEILIGLLTLFSLNKCTQSCNRDTKINTQQIEIIQKDSIIKTQKEQLDILKIRWADAMSNQSTYQGLALGTKQVLLDSINVLKNEKHEIQEKLRKSEIELNRIKKENIKLKEQIK